MTPQLPFDPVSLVLNSFWHGIGLAASMFIWAPIWVQLALIAAVIIRIYRPAPPAEERLRKRSRRRRWRDER